MITYNGTQASTLGMIIKGSNRPILPPITPRLIQLPGRAGAHYAGADLGPRLITIPFALIAGTREQLREKIRMVAAWLAPGTAPAQLHFADEPGRYYNAVVVNPIDVDQVYSIGGGQVQFLCPDPYAYSDNELAQVCDPGLTQVGNQGTAATLPRLVASFTASSAELRMTNTETGQFVRIDRAFSAGDTAEIDCARALVTVNGARAMDRLDLASDFFALKPGTNSLSVTAGCQATAYWRERWL